MDLSELTPLVFDELQEIDKIIKKPCEILLKTTGHLAYTGFSVSVSINAVGNSSDIISGFNLTQFPGQCGILISHETYQPLPYQRRGLSVPIQKMKAKIAKHLRYTILMATTVIKNNNDKVMERSGFTKLDRLYFNNRRTANQITTWIKML